MRRLAAAFLLLAILLAGCASRAADERRARADLVKRLEAAVTARARMQAATGVFKGPVLRTRCDPALGTVLNLADCYEKAGRLASAWSRFVEAEGMAHAEGHTDAERIARERASKLKTPLRRSTFTMMPFLRSPTWQAH